MTLLFLFTSCEEKNYFKTGYVDTTISLEPLMFDFATTQDVNFNFNYTDVPSGFVSEFNVYKENPYKQIANGGWILRDDVTPITAGIHVNGLSKIIRTIPAYVKELYVYSPSLFVPQLSYAQIINGAANFASLELPVPEQPTDTRSLSNGSIDRSLSTNARGAARNTVVVNNNHRPNYIDASKTITVPTSILNKISNTFPDGAGTKVTAAQYYQDALVYLHEDARIWISVVHSDGSYNSGLSYFYFKGTPEELKSKTLSNHTTIKEIVAFPLAKLNQGSANTNTHPKLKPGEYVELKFFGDNPGGNNNNNWNSVTVYDKFPEGYTIGFILRSNGYSTSDKYLSNSTTNRFFSVKEWNPETDLANRDHTIYFNAGTTDNPFFCFGFEDMNNKDGDGDCNDVMFNIQLDPITAIDPPEEIPEVGTKEKEVKSNGILAFEDNWPRQGDYDMNDVVVEYKSTVTEVQDTETLGGVTTDTGDPYIRKIDNIFTLMHNGASYYNNFNLHIGIDPAKVKSVQLSTDGRNYADCAKTPVTNDGKKGFIIQVIPQIRSVLTQYVIYDPADYVPYYIRLEFYTGVGENVPETEKALRMLADDFYADKLKHAPYNPYISPSPHIQVHLIDYPPARDVNMESHGQLLFGTFSDRTYTDFIENTNPYETGTFNKWYVSGYANGSYGFPFAIHLADVTATQFTIPTERVRVDQTFPRYKNWVETEGREDADWYR